MTDADKALQIAQGKRMLELEQRIIVLEKHRNELEMAVWVRPQNRDQIVAEGLRRLNEQMVALAEALSHWLPDRDDL